MRDQNRSSALSVSIAQGSDHANSIEDVIAVVSALVQATVDDRDGKPGLKLVVVDPVGLLDKLRKKWGREPTAGEIDAQTVLAEREWPGDSARWPGQAPKILAKMVVAYLTGQRIPVAMSVDEIAAALVPGWMDDLERRAEALVRLQELPTEQQDLAKFAADQELERRVLGHALRAAAPEGDQAHDDRVRDLLRGPTKARRTRESRSHFVDFVRECCTSLHDVALGRELLKRLGRTPTADEIRTALIERSERLAIGRAEPMLPNDDDLRSVQDAVSAITEVTRLSTFRRAYAKWCQGKGLRPVLNAGKFAKALSNELLKCGGVTPASATAPGGKRIRGFRGIGLRNT